MLIYKVMFWLGLALIAILVIENMVIPTPAYLFWIYSRTALVIFTAAACGTLVGYGLGKMLEDKPGYEDENDFDY